MLDRETIYNDYLKINDYPSLAEKKIIAERYSIVSKKTKEIELAILNAAREERKIRNTFDEIDLIMYSRFDIPERYTNAVKFYSEECIDFLMFLKDVYYKDLIKRKLIDNLSNPRSCSISAADRYYINRYNNVVKYLDETNPETIKKKMEIKSIEDEIKNILLSELKTFHDSYISSVMNWAYKQFDKNLSHLKDFQELSNNVDDISNVKGYKNYLKLKAFFIRYKTKENFIEDVRNTTENKYNATINELTDRIRTKKLNHKNITIKRVKTDPKLFEMVITDGEITMYARSIWCAEYSDIVTPYYRFIIT